MLALNLLSHPEQRVGEESVEQATGKSINGQWATTTDIVEAPAGSEHANMLIRAADILQEARDTATAMTAGVPVTSAAAERRQNEAAAAAAAAATAAVARVTDSDGESGSTAVADPASVATSARAGRVGGAIMNDGSKTHHRNQRTREPRKKTPANPCPSPSSRTSS